MDQYLVGCWTQWTPHYCRTTQFSFVLPLGFSRKFGSCKGSLSTKKCIQATRITMFLEVKKSEQHNRTAVVKICVKRKQGFSITSLTQLPLFVHLTRKFSLNVIFQSLLGKSLGLFMYPDGFLASLFPLLVAFAHPWDFAKSGNFATKVMKLSKILKNRTAELKSTALLHQDHTVEVATRLEI